MEGVFKTLNLSDNNKIFRGYTTMIELYNALKFITMLLFIQNILTCNLGVAFIKSVDIRVKTFKKLGCFKTVKSAVICRVLDILT